MQLHLHLPVLFYLSIIEYLINATVFYLLMTAHLPFTCPVSLVDDNLRDIHDRHYVQAPEGRKTELMLFTIVTVMQAMRVFILPSYQSTNKDKNLPVKVLKDKLNSGNDKNRSIITPLRIRRELDAQRNADEDEVQR